MNFKIKIIVAILSGVMIVSSSCNTNQAPDNLFQELGGLDTLELVVDTWIDSLQSDVLISSYFSNVFNDSIATLNFRNHVVEQFCSLSGGPCVYKGRDMQLVHHPLHIQPEDFEKSVNYLRNVLNMYIADESIVLNFIVRVQLLEPAIVNL